MQVKVWNTNVHPYKEKFRGEWIEIAAGGYITMEEEEANIFRGTMKPPIATADGGHDPVGFKMIKIEKAPQRDIGVELETQFTKTMTESHEGETPFVDAAAEEYLKANSKNISRKIK